MGPGLLARRPGLTVLVGAVAIAFSGIIFRVSHVSASTGAFYRCLLALPPDAMTSTRRLARADLAALFEADLEPELQRVIAGWWSSETQATLRALAERLGKKTG